MDANLLLAVATLALVVGPFLARFSRRFAAAAALVDGVTVGGIVVVALLHLLPEAAAHIGWWAPLLLIVGLVLPLATERLLVRSWQGWRVTVGFLVLVLFVAHLLFEGAALASTAADERLALATVIVVAGHNLPLGLLLWGQTEKRFGRAASIGVLLATAAVTWFGPVVIDTGEGVLAAVCSALLAGGLLHLVLQHEPHLHESPVLRNRWCAIGAVVAGAVLVLYLGGEGGHGGHQHREDAGALGARFMELFLETAPPLLLGVVGAALIEAFLPGSFKRWLGRGPRLVQALRGVALGTPMPVCSCGVLPIYRSLVKSGVPTTAALSLLIAAPEIGVDSLLLSLPLLGGPTTAARVGSALLLALLVGWAVGGAAERAGLSVDPVPDDHEEPPPRRSLVALRRGLLETWGHLAPWILVGLYATAFVEPLISTSWARDLAPWMQIAVLTMLGLPTYICATAATPLAALLLATGFAPGAVIAFLLTGPATNLTTFGALRRLHSPRVAWLFVAVAVGGTFLIGLGVDQILPAERVRPPASFTDHEHGLLQQVSAWVLVALTLWVLLREGPRSFLGQLRPDGGEHRHDHDRGDGEAAACGA